MVSRSVPKLNAARIRQGSAPAPGLFKQMATKLNTNQVPSNPFGPNNVAPGLFDPPVFGQPAGGAFFGSAPVPQQQQVSSGGLFGQQQQQQQQLQHQQQQFQLQQQPQQFQQQQQPQPGFGAFGILPQATGLFGTAQSQTIIDVLAEAEEEEESFEEVVTPSSEPTTIVTESPLSISYAVEGQSTIPSDGVAHQVPVAILTFDSKVTYVCCPKIDARVYLQVSFGCFM